MANQKGLVLEAGENWAIILSERGEYKRIKTRKLLQVGEIWQKPAGHLIRYAVAAVICLALLGAAYGYFPVVAYAQVSSGLELGINRWERVVSVRPLDDNGVKIMQEVDLRGRSVEQAVDMLVDKTTSSDDSAEKNREIVLEVVAKKPGYEQFQQNIRNKLEDKVKLISPDNLENKKNVPTGHARNKNVHLRNGLDLTKPAQKNLNNKSGKSQGSRLRPEKDRPEPKVEINSETKDNAKKINDNSEKQQNFDKKKNNRGGKNKELRLDADKRNDRNKGKGKEESKRDKTNSSKPNKKSKD